MATEQNVSPHAEQRPESGQPTGQEPGDGERQPMPAPAPARARPAETDGDVVVDVPQLSVDELNLEIHAPILEQVKVEAKGLQVGLFAKVDLDNVVAMTGKRPVRRLPDIEGRSTPAGKQREASDAEANERQEGMRDDIEQLLESAKEAYDKLSERDAEEQVRDVYETARQAYARITGRGEDSGVEGGGERERADGETRKSRGDATGRRAMEIAKQGGKAAGLTAVGVAGGAALESALHSGRPRLPLPMRRHSRGPKGLVENVRDRLG